MRDSDGTLILAPGKPVGGTLLTVRLARRYGRPLCAVDLDKEGEIARVCDWLVEHRIAILNVAGPRASGCAGIQARVTDFLARVFSGSTPQGRENKA